MIMVMEMKLVLKRILIAVSTLISIGVVYVCLIANYDFHKVYAADPPVGNFAVTIPEAEHERRCDALVGTGLETGTIEEVELVEPGDHLVPFLFRILLKWNVPGYSHLRAPVTFCQVTAKLRPVAGSEITLKAWLPQQWNGKTVALGGGGFNGGLTAGPLTMMEPVGRGYVTLVTDAGHEDTESAQFTHDNEIQFVDYAYRANHVAAVFAKSLVASHYQEPAARAYFHGCSNGGRDALMEASRYPEDFDGIIAGAPAADWTGLMTSFAWNAQAFDTAPNLGTKLQLVNEAVIKACDKVDGVQDSLLENPQSCNFDPANLQCTDVDGPDCLNADEVAALDKIYEGPHLDDGTRVYAGMPVGGETEDNWGPWITSEESAQRNFAVETIRWMVYGDPEWDISDFDIDRDYPKIVERVTPIMNSDNPDISAFADRGGRLLMYHGWNDAAIPAGSAIDYVEAVRETLGPVADDHVRLFMVPGLNHCFGGSGPTSFDMLEVLDGWVESGDAPERIIAAQYDPMAIFMKSPDAELVRTRPLCPWPKVARYSGQGSTDEAASFSCQ